MDMNARGKRKSQFPLWRKAGRKFCGVKKQVANERNKKKKNSPTKPFGQLKARQ